MIDWSRPVYVETCADPLIPMSQSGNGEQTFRGFEIPNNRERGHVYYNEDGRPFKGAPPISHTPGFEIDIPESDFDRQRREEQDAMERMLEAIPGYGAFA